MVRYSVHVDVVQYLLQQVGFFVQTSWLKGASINLSVNNPLVWTNYSGYNPEMGTRGNPLQPGFDTLRYPSSREVILGLTAQF